MFPNLLGQKAFHHMSDADMATVIGVSRNTYQQIIKSGRFTPEECKSFCAFFEKKFEYLFASNDDEATN